MPISVSTVINQLKIVADGYKAQGNVIKAKAYRVAMDSITEKYGGSGNIESVDALISLKGVGKGMVEKVREMLNNEGNLLQADAVRANPTTQALQLLESVHGVGPVLANKLVRELNITTIEQLKAQLKIHPALINNKSVEIGLRYYEDSQLKIPFDECEVIARAISAVARAIDPKLRAICVGSHRREKEMSGDIDILVTHPMSHSSVSGYDYLPRLLAALQRGDAQGVTVLKETLASGASKFMGFVQLRQPGSKVRRLDMRWVGADCFFSMLLHFTGSAQSNVRMRQIAIEKELRLNEWGLWKAPSGPVRRDRDGDDDDDHSNSGNAAASAASTKGAVTAKGATAGMELAVVPACEADLFSALGLKYIKPQQREGFSSHHNL